MNSQNDLGRFIEVQLIKWESLKSQKAPGADLKNLERPVITLSSESGCGAESIARMLAKEFGFDFFGFELVDMIAQNTHLSKRLIATLDEKTQSAIEDMVEGMLAASVGEEHFSSENYLLNLGKVVLTIATQGNAVILGRGASFLLKAEDRLAIRFIAPLEVRVKNVMLEEHLTEQQSRDYIAAKEEERRLYIKRYFHAEIEDPANYDLVINTASIKPKTIIEMTRVVIVRCQQKED